MFQGRINLAKVSVRSICGPWKFAVSEIFPNPHLIDRLRPKNKIGQSESALVFLEDLSSRLHPFYATRIEIAYNKMFSNKI